MTSAVSTGGGPSSRRWAKRWVVDPAGCCSLIRRATASSSTSGPRTTRSLAGGTPILALDMYEHSYHMDYGAAATKYVDAFMENIRWSHVAALYKAQPSARRENLCKGAHHELLEPY